MTGSQFPLEYELSCSCPLTSVDTVMLLLGKIHIIAILGLFLCVTIRHDLVHATSSMSVLYFDFHCIYVDL